MSEDRSSGPASERRRVEIVHESLLSKWPRLVRWQAQDEEGALLRDQLRQAAQVWDQHGRSEDFLWSGSAYREYQVWRERYPGGLSALEEAFARAMTARALRRRRRRRLVVAAAFAAIVAVATATGMLWRRSETARDRAVAAGQKAEAEALRAEASKVVTLGRLELEADPTSAGGAAGEPARLGRSAGPWFTSARPQRWALDVSDTGIAYFSGPEVRLLRLPHQPGAERLVGRHRAAVVRVALDPSGGRIAAADGAGEIRIWSLDREPPRVLVASPPSPYYWYTALDFDRTGSKLAAASQGGKVLRVWDLAAPPAFEPLDLRGATAFIHESRFDAVGRWVAAVDHASAILWPLVGPYPVVIRGHRDAVGNTVFGPDGTWVATSTWNEVRFWSLRGAPGGSRVLFEAADPSWCCELAAAPDGRTVVASVGGHGVYVLPMDGGTPRRLPGPAGPDFSGGTALALSADGRRVAAAPVVGAGAGFVHLWDLRSGERRTLDAALPAGQMIVSLAFAADGRLIEGGGAGIRAWDLEDGTSTLLLENRAGELTWFSMSGNRRVLLVHRSAGQGEAGTPMRLQLYDLENGSVRSLTTHGAYVNGVLDSSGSVVATIDSEGIIRVGRVTAEEPHLLFGNERGVRPFGWSGLAVSADGRWIASGGTDTTVRIWAMPDLTKPPLHTLPYEEFLAKLRSFTNLRAVREPTSPTGYALEIGPNPGWEQVPQW